jgi:Domain of unknown function (DUF4388)
MAEKTFQYRGDLRQTTLPDILFTVNHHRLPGVIEARQAGQVKEVWVREGSVVHAASNHREDSLGRFLLRTGKISEAAFTETMQERATSERRFGALLVERGTLAPGQVYQAIKEQTEEIVWSLFTWEEGEVTYRISEFGDTSMVRIHLPLRRVIVQGIRRSPSAKALVARLGRKESVYEPCYRVEDLIEIGLGADEYRLLARVDGRRDLADLCNNGPLPAAENARLLYAFQVLQLIRRAEDQSGAGGLKIRLRTEGDEFQ